MNWLAIILIAIGALALIIFLAIRNQKDERKFENDLNKDYRKSKDEEDDIDIDEVMK
jgi:FtsZ-interacting cell division protein ZipA